MFNASGYYLANYGQGTMCVTVKSDVIIYQGSGIPKRNLKSRIKNGNFAK